MPSPYDRSPYSRPSMPVSKPVLVQKAEMLKDEIISRWTAVTREAEGTVFSVYEIDDDLKLRRITLEMTDEQVQELRDALTKAITKPKTREEQAAFAKEWDRKVEEGRQS